ncbi:MAG: hypothetical protein ABW048_13480 [Sphingobium sp.]
MNFPGKSMMFGIALAVAGTGAVTAVPAQAQTQVYVGLESGYRVAGWQDAGWRADRYRDGYRDFGRGDRNWRGDGWRGDRRWRGDERWRGNGWRGDGWRNNSWRGGYRERCWTEWRRSPYGRRAVRICR